MLDRNVVIQVVCGILIPILVFFIIKTIRDTKRLKENETIRNTN